MSECCEMIRDMNRDERLCYKGSSRSQVFRQDLYRMQTWASQLIGSCKRPTNRKAL